MNNSQPAASSNAILTEALSFERIFEAQPGLALILSPELNILAVTAGFLRETGRAGHDLAGSYLFDAFPDNPAAPENLPAATLKALLLKTLADPEPRQLSSFRYEFHRETKPATSNPAYWSAEITPVAGEPGLPACLLLSLENITEQVTARQAQARSYQIEQAALAQARQHRNRLDRLFRQAPAALAILEGPDLVFREINESFQQLFPGRKLSSVPLFKALPEIVGQPIEHIIREVYRTGITFEGEEQLVPVVRQEGQPIEDAYWNFIYQALFDTAGQVNGILIFALDVTSYVQARQLIERSAGNLKSLNRKLEQGVESRTHELRLAQAEAERQRWQLQNLFMNAPAAICILAGPDLVFELVNPSYQELFRGRELLGKPLLQALPEIEGNSVYRTFREVYETGATHEEYELLIPLANPANGQLENRYFRFIQQARFNHQHQIDGILVFAYEVTEQVEARKAAEASARKLRLLTDSLPVLIGYLDKEERYRFANRAYKAWFRQEPEALLGRSVREVVGPEAYKAVKGYLDRALAGERLDFEAAMPYREDFTRHIRTSYVPDVKEGQVIGFYTLVTDITNEIHIRQALEKSEHEARALAEKLVSANQELQTAIIELGNSNQQLMHTNADLDNFIYTASHDLRAPISNIEMLLSELLQELPGSLLQQPDVELIIRMMQSAIERFKKTIAHLTEITRLQKENTSEAQLLHFGKIVEDVRLDLEPLIKESGAQVHIAIEEHYRISFSEKNLRSIVYNLFSNALKYRHPGRISQVQLSCREEAGYLVLSVHDNGLGLSSGQQQQLFSMFRRFHDHVEGSGVGLYMVKRMVDNAGGKIEVQSVPGQGSEFKVHFRVVEQ